MSAAANPVQLKSPVASGKYANMVYSEFGRKCADKLNVVPIDMGYGDPANNKYIPKGFRDAMVNELDQLNAGSYPHVEGDVELQEKLKKYIQLDEGAQADYQLVIVTSGGRSAITNVIKTWLSSGDVILIPYPAWSGYKACAGFNGAKIFPIRTSIENKFVPTEGDIKAAIVGAKNAYPSGRVKMMILNSPHNPTGTVYSEADIRNVLKVLNENNINCLADYTYRAIRDRSIRVPSVLKVAEEMEAEMGIEAGTITDKIVSMQTLGKVSLTPGLRVGYIATTNRNFISQFLINKQATDFAGSQFLQRALGKYLHTEIQAKEFAETISLFDARRRCFLQAIEKYGYSIGNKNVILGTAGFYLSFQVPRKYQHRLPLAELDTLMQQYPFIPECINKAEYEGYFRHKGYIPASELFVLALIAKTGINVLPGRLFCSTHGDDEEYETWVRVALIQDEKAIEEFFARIERAGKLLEW